jgi:metal-dependent amidase/aminoacylase/carboxypeptidase family protein
VRVHPIITKGGDVVNAVPAEVRLEMYVRGRTIEAIRDANAKVDRALKAGALAVGARVEITTTPGYLPLRSDPELTALYKRNAITHVGEANVGETPSDSLNNSGSTDMGDVSWLMPTIQPFANGFEGQIHGDNFVTTDWKAAIANPAAVTAATVVDLLADGAGEARRVSSAYAGGMSKDDYLAYLRSMAAEETYEGVVAPTRQLD